MPIKLGLLSVYLVVSISMVAQTQSVSNKGTTYSNVAPPALLSKSLSAVGGASLVGSIKDYVATGTITYRWAGKDIKGQATLRWRADHQVRLDAKLPEGTRSWYVNNGSGKLRDIAGAISTIPYHNTMSLEDVVFPYVKIVRVLRDPEVHVPSLKQVAVGGTRFEKIHIEPVGQDSHLNKLSTVDYFIDPSTLLILGVHDQTHPEKNMDVDIPHAVYYGDYRATPAGIRFPFAVSETMNAERMWSMQIDSVSFNVGLSDTDFQF